MEIEYVREDPAPEQNSLTEKVFGIAVYVMMLAACAACLMLSLAAVFAAYGLMASAWGLL